MGSKEDFRLPLKEHLGDGFFDRHQKTSLSASLKRVILLNIADAIKHSEDRRQIEVYITLKHKLLPFPLDFLF